MASTTPNTCPTCNGAGEDPPGELCGTCYGQSTVPIRGWARKVFKEHRQTMQDLSDAITDVADKCDDIKEVVDEIKTVVDAL